MKTGEKMISICDFEDLTIAPNFSASMKYPYEYNSILTCITCKAFPPNLPLCRDMFTEHFTGIQMEFGRRELPPMFRVTWLRCLHPFQVDTTEGGRSHPSGALKREQDITWPMTLPWRPWCTCQLLLQTTLSRDQPREWELLGGCSSELMTYFCCIYIALAELESNYSIPTQLQTYTSFTYNCSNSRPWEIFLYLLICFNCFNLLYIFR